MQQVRDATHHAQWSREDIIRVLLHRYFPSSKQHANKGNGPQPNQSFQILLPLSCMSAASPEYTCARPDLAAVVRNCSVKHIGPRRKIASTKTEVRISFKIRGVTFPGPQCWRVAPAFQTPQ